MAPRPITVHAPDASAVSVTVTGSGAATGDGSTVALSRHGHGFRGTFEAEVGDRYWLTVDGIAPLLDPHCLDLVWTSDGPCSVVRDPWPRRAQGARRAYPDGVGPVVYEAHVRGFARTFAGMADRLDHLVDLGVDVVELMPVHPFDPSDNYWGYMPLVWGAVHRPFAADEDDAAGELADLIAAAHERGLHVWLDVVFNHTGEGDATLPTRSLRGIDDAHAYRHRADGSYVDDSGCGNDIDPADEEVRRLVEEALDRLAALGFDGFRFDLASLLTRDGGGLVEQITGWALGRGIELIAEPWDLGSYQLGAAFPEPTWWQWNDRFRDQVRGFLRAEPGQVPNMIQRIGGSPDLFDGELRSVNFVTAHDGLTMYDLTIVTDDHFHSWACGESLQMQQLKNYFTILLLSAGASMFVMGDEFARTQDGDPNPYDVDGPRTWVDWSRLDEWAELHAFVRSMLALRKECPPVGHRFYGASGAADTSDGSRSIAFATDHLYVMVNAWWEPLEFTVQEPGDWTFAISTIGGSTGPVPPRSIRILRR
jgi:isoamylase